MRLADSVIGKGSLLAGCAAGGPSIAIGSLLGDLLGWKGV